MLMPSMVFLSGGTDSEGEMENLKREIMEVERAFAEMAAEKGIKDAFLFFAAEDSAIMRNNKVYKGKDEIGKYFDSVTLRDIKLNWKPDFVDLSASGDLAYTYGKYIFSARDEAGKTISSEGIFHTVWKKQVDGNWKYVWD